MACRDIRGEALLVDEDEGAGLELAPTERGLRVLQVLEFPGQRVFPGDVILSIDGEDLSRAASSVSAPLDRFERRLHHGAEVQVLESSEDPSSGEVRFRCPRCRRGFASWQPCFEHHLRTWRVEEGAGQEQPPPRLMRTWMSEATAAMQAFKQQLLETPGGSGQKTPTSTAAASSPAQPKVIPGLRFKKRPCDTISHSSADRWVTAVEESSAAVSSSAGPNAAADSSADVRATVHATALQQRVSQDKQEEKAGSDSSDSEICVMAEPMMQSSNQREHASSSSKTSHPEAASLSSHAASVLKGSVSTSQSQSQSHSRAAQVDAEGAEDAALRDAQHAGGSAASSSPPPERQKRPRPWRRRDAVAQFVPPRPRSWWAQHFEVSRNRVGAIVLRIALPEAKVKAEDVRSITTAADNLLHDLRLQLQGGADAYMPLRVGLDVDLTSNRIGNAGAVCLCRWFLRHRRELRCRSLRLSDTGIGDEALLWLAEVIRAQHSAMEVLELAQNPFSEIGIAAVLAAVALHPLEAYPWLGGNGTFEPLRVDVTSAQTTELLALLRCLKLRVDLRWSDGGELRSKATSLSIASAPHVQVLQPVLLSSKSDSTATLSERALDFIEKVCLDPLAWNAPALSGPLLLPLPPCITGTVPVPGGLRPPVPTGRAMLHVDDEAGAGIELEAVDEGLRLSAVLPHPGQPDLQPGDILVAMDGWPLSSFACEGDEDKQHDRFAEHFRHGATLDILPSVRSCPDGDRSAGTPLRSGGDATFRCPQCWEPFKAWPPCLEHLRATDHAPPEPPQAHGPREDTSACLRRWMSTCLAAARGDLQPPDCSMSGASSVQDLDGVLLRVPRLSCQNRCPMVVNHLALESIRCADRHACCVWLQQHGLELRGAKGLDFAAVAEDIVEVLRYAIPDIEQKAEKEQDSQRASQQAQGDEQGAGGWAQWMQCMVEQQAGEDPRDDADRAAGGMSSLRASAAPFVPQAIACEAASLRVLVLCGLPGSGKSTLAARLRVELGWTIVNQDTLTSRQACLKAARDALRVDGGKVVIDRCNFNVAQRSPWIQLGMHEFGLRRHELCCVWLDVPIQECDRRVLTRLGHSTLPAKASSLEVLRRFQDAWQPPDLSEGFGLMRRLASDIDNETFCAELRSGAQDIDGLLTSMVAEPTVDPADGQQDLPSKAPGLFHNDEAAAQLPSEEVSFSSGASPAVAAVQSECALEALRSEDASSNCTSHAAAAALGVQPADAALGHCSSNASLSNGLAVAATDHAKVTGVEHNDDTSPDSRSSSSLLVTNLEAEATSCLPALQEPPRESTHLQTRCHTTRVVPGAEDDMDAGCDEVRPSAPGADCEADPEAAVLTEDMAAVANQALSASSANSAGSSAPLGALSLVDFWRVPLPDLTLDEEP